MKKEMNYVIYGAQGYALGTYEAVKTIYPERNVSCFVVTSKEGNPEILSGLPVKELDVFSKDMSDDDKKSVHVLIATPENVQDEIVNSLKQNGFVDIERIDSKKWASISEKFHAVLGQFTPLGMLPAGEMLPHIHVYMAKSHKDKSLLEDFDIPSFTIPIQVGAVNTCEKIADVRDDEGDNISNKNGNYCELTGLYWIWKNVLCNDMSDTNAIEYYGLAQYRRVLMLSDEALKRLCKNDVDVVLPYPLLYEPSINAHRLRYLKEEDWKTMLVVLRELQPEYAIEFERILDQKFLFNYNVIIAKKNVLKKYCEWLFQILEKVEELSEPKGCDRSDRYIGYMGEILETLYFMRNQHNLKIVYTGCRLLV